MKKHMDIRVYGEVQGVSFRAYSQAVAKFFHITGTIENKEDGSVFARAEGEQEDLENFLAWCRKGPPLARVEKVEHSFSDTLEGFSEFTVL